jgi:hypothetical protein
MAITRTDDLPEPIDLSHLYSSVSANRGASSIKAFYKYFQIPGIGQLAGGMLKTSPFHPLNGHLPGRWDPRR